MHSWEQVSIPADGADFNSRTWPGWCSSHSLLTSKSSQSPETVSYSLKVVRTAKIKHPKTIRNLKWNKKHSIFNPLCICTGDIAYKIMSRDLHGMASPCWREWGGFWWRSEVFNQVGAGGTGSRGKISVRMFLGQTCCNQPTFFRNEMGDSAFWEGIAWYGRGLCCSGGLFQAVCCPDWHCSYCQWISLAHPEAWERVNASLQGSTGTNPPLKTAFLFLFCSLFALISMQMKRQKGLKE